MSCKEVKNHVCECEDMLVNVAKHTSFLLTKCEDSHHKARRNQLTMHTAENNAKQANLGVETMGVDIHKASLSVGTHIHIHTPWHKHTHIFSYSHAHTHTHTPRHHHRCQMCRCPNSLCQSCKASCRALHHH